MAISLQNLGRTRTVLKLIKAQNIIHFCAFLQRLRLPFIYSQHFKNSEDEIIGITFGVGFRVNKNNDNDSDKNNDNTI
jgi:hypothetical protein